MGGFNPKSATRAIRALNVLRPDMGRLTIDPRQQEVRGFEEEDDVEITSEDEAIRILEEELAELKKNRSGS